MNSVPLSSITALTVANSPAPCLRPDRKSTRLNSSHLVISYAVFCLKKKKTSAQRRPPLRLTISNELSTPLPLLGSSFTLLYDRHWRGAPSAVHLSRHHTRRCLLPAA